MPAAVRLGDISTGHPHCYPSRPNVEGSPDVRINGLPVHRVGDAWAVHGACPNHTPHAGVASGGSPNVYVNGRPVCRIGDPVSCGDTMAEGSPNVLVNGR